MSDEIVLIGDILGSILQPIYFSLFLFYTKDIKDKRALFTIIMILETLFLRCILKIYNGIDFEILYSISMYIVLRLIYQKKARITDIVTFILSVIFQGIISVSTILILGVNIYSIIVSSIVLIIITYLLKNKLIKIENFYNRFWNKHNNPKFLKSVTIRGFSSVITIITFVLMYFWLIYGILKMRR